MYRMRWFLAVLRSLFHSSLSYTFSCHSSLPTILPSSLTSSSHLFLGLPLGLVVSRFIYDTLLEIPFSSILCTCPNQRNLCSLTVSVTVSFLIFTRLLVHKNSAWNYLFSPFNHNVILNLCSVFDTFLNTIHYNTIQAQMLEEQLIPATNIVQTLIPPSYILLLSLFPTHPFNYRYHMM